MADRVFLKSAVSTAPWSPSVAKMCSCSTTNTHALLLERQKREGIRVWVAVSLCPALGRHGVAQARRAASTLISSRVAASVCRWATCIKSLPMCNNCCRQLVVLGAEKKGFSRSWYPPVLEKAGTQTNSVQK